MIRLFIGGVGSGKTISAVKEIISYNGKFNVYTNIALKGKHKNVFPLKPEYIIKKVLKGEKKHRDGRTETVWDYELNMDFWKDKQPLCVCIDEVHNILNARTFMSKKNRTVNKWLTMIRRILGSTTQSGGELILIAQLTNQVDNIARDLCHQIRYHLCHYSKTCKKCGFTWKEDSDVPEPKFMCPSCGHDGIKKHSHFLEVWAFRSAKAYKAWLDFGIDSYYRHYFINDVEDYFSYYNTYQWDNLFEDY